MLPFQTSSICANLAKRLARTAAFALALALPWGGLAWGAASTSDRLSAEDAAFLKYLERSAEPARTANESPFRDVSPNHWAYQAVVHLARKGLLDGDADGLLRGDRPVTRYELAVILQKMMANYMAYKEAGPTPAPTEAKTAPKEGKSDGDAEEEEAAEKKSKSKSAAKEKSGGEDGEEAEGSGEKDKSKAKEDKEENGEPAVAKAVATAPGGLMRKGPKTLGEEKKTDKKSDSKNGGKEENGEKKTEIKIKAPILKKVAKEIELTEKDVKLFETLYNHFNDEIKETKKELGKEIGKVKSMASKNEGDIRRLKDEDQRFRITGSGSFSITTEADIPPFKEEPDIDHATSYSIGRNVDYSVSIKAQRNIDLTIGGCAVSSCGAPTFSYRDLTRGANKNIFMRELILGSTSAPFSPLSAFGGPSDFIGGRSQFKLNDYTVYAMVGKNGTANVDYGFSLQSNLFNNPESLFNVSRFVNYENKEDQRTITYGTFDNNAELTCAKKSLPIGDIVDPTNTDSPVCVPPNSNSVSDVFFKYPLPNIKGGRFFLTFDYAHSNFHRDGFNMEVVDAETKFPGAVKFAPKDKYQSDSGPAWRPVDPQTGTGKGLLILLDYNKGPLKLPVMGYARLGCNFNSKFMGLASLNIEDITKNLGSLPIQLQCLEAAVMLATYDMTSSRKYKYDMTVVDINEYKALTMDLSKVPGTFNQFPLLAASLNNRRDDLLIKGFYMAHKYQYFIKSGFSISGEYKYTEASLGPGCLDTTLIEIKDNAGNILDKRLGDGIQNCDLNAPEPDAYVMLRFKQREQSYGLYYRVSSKSDYNLSYSLQKQDLRGQIGNVQADSLLTPENTEYKMNHSLSYRINSISSVSFGWEKIFGREGLESLDPDLLIQDHSKFTFSYGTSF